MKNLNATMESSVLHELACFDIRAPIQISISFDDSTEGEEVTVKTENVTDDDNIYSQETNNLPKVLLSPKKDQSHNNELNSDQHSEQNNSKERITLQTEILQNTKTNSDGERKRKQDQLKIYNNKRCKTESTPGNVPNNITGYKETETFASTAHFAHQDVDTSPLNPINVASTDGFLSPTINNCEKDVIKSSKLTLLASVSENMRLVMEAYEYHIKNNTPYDSYEKIKNNLFNESYNAIIKLVVPEERNREFILSFLLNTYQHAVKYPGLNKYGFNVYVILIKELIDWAKTEQKNQTTSKEENTVQSTLIGSNCCQGQVLENRHNKTEDNGSNNKTKPDTICIFSAGPPGNEISINFDPNLNQCMSTSNNIKIPNKEASVVQNPKKLSLDLQRTQIPYQTHTQLRTQGNKKNKHLQELLQRPPLIQQLAPWNANKPFNSPVKGNSTTNDILKNQIDTRLPQVQNPIDSQNGYAMPGQSQYLQPQSIPSLQMLPQPRPSVNTGRRQQTRAPSPYNQSTRPPPPSYDSRIWSQPWQQQVQSQFANSQHMQSHYNQLKHVHQYGPPQQHNNMLPQANGQYGQNRKVQSEIEQLQNMQLQYGQFQQVQNKNKTLQNVQSQFGLYQQVLNNIGQVPNMQPQYGHFQQVQIQTQLLSMQPQHGQVLTRQSQQSLLPQNVPQHVSQIGQPSLVSPECEKRLQTGEWRQGLIDLYHHQGQTQQPLKNAPRSSSTDSGFASPLNFNTSSDQTLPPVPDDTEPSPILITHVTSLNPKVPYMAEGNCVICNKATKKVCMGCMKVYYCTYECQLQDWTTHGPNCYSQPSTTTLMRETNHDQLQS